MKLNKSKRGISLIVLVITIIVMIILATAIILSLNSSNISGKASEAKLSSDLANKKEAASVYLAEYELKVAKGKIDKTETTANDYVREEMKKAGIDISDVAVTAEGEIIVGTAAQFVNLGVQIGDTVQGYDISKAEDSYTTSGYENMPGYDEQTGADKPVPQIITKDNNITWKYVGNDEEGNVLLLADMSSSSQTIYLNDNCYGPYLLDKICNTLYSSNMGEARSINLDDVTRILEYKNIGYSYWDGNTDGSGYSQIYELLTLREFYSKFNVDITNFPSDVKDNLDNILLNDIELNASETEKYNAERKTLIFQSKSYWLASCTFAPYSFSGQGPGEPNMPMVSSYSISGYTFGSFCNCTDKDPERFAMAYSAAIRPIVKLLPNLKVTYSGGVATLS